MARTIYTPDMVEILEVRDETPDTRSLKLRFTDHENQANFSFIPGQFGLYSVYGEGESTFCIASPSTWTDSFECCFRVVGRVTKALRMLGPGDVIGFRGPYGNGFPMERFEGRNLVFVAGGLGLPPLRTVIRTVLDPSMRERFGEVTIIYGARSVNDLVYKAELAEWNSRDDVTLVRTVDPGGETSGWDGREGFVPSIVEDVWPSCKNTVALVCGPPVMIKFTIPVLNKIGFDLSSIYTTLENRMKCGLGKCGRCNVAGFYVCKEGPVITASQLEELPPEY